MTVSSKAYSIKALWASRPVRIMEDLKLRSLRSVWSTTCAFNKLKRIQAIIAIEELAKLDASVSVCCDVHNTLVNVSGISTFIDRTLFCLYRL